jgi:Serine dehydrogenase proteinase
VRGRRRGPLKSIIDYIRSKFGKNIRVIVPQISMSGGTMIALAGREIVMGAHSNLGPIDPQIGGKPAIAILKEFETARNEISADPHRALLWQPILQQFSPTLLSLADHSIKWAREIGKKTLTDGMYDGDIDAAEKAEKTVDFLLSHDLHKAHGRHLHRSELTAQGLVITNLENDGALQDAVLSVHHSCMLTVGNFGAAKLIENHNGITHAKVVGQIQIPMQGLVQLTPAAAPQANPAVVKVARPIVLAAALVIVLLAVFGLFKLITR